MSGAPAPDDLAGALRDAGFEQVCIKPKPQSVKYISMWLPGSRAEDYVLSANITAIKPALGLQPAVAAKAPKSAAAADEEAMPARMRAKLAPKQAPGC